MSATDPPPSDLCQYVIGSCYSPPSPPAPGAWSPSGDDVEAQAERLVTGAAGCLRGPPPVCKDDDACGTTVPVVGQMKNAAEDARSPSPRLNAEHLQDVPLDCDPLV